MRPPPASRALIAGVAVSATAGALVAMGRRVGGAGRPFIEMAAAALPRASSGTAAAIALGFGVHVAVIIVWALAFVWLANRLNRVIVAAIAIGVADFLASWIVARSTGRGIASLLPLGDRLTLSLILAGALVVGMRYARPSSRNA